MKIAVVTGGRRGLGRAFAQALAAAGWQVAIVTRQAVEVDGAQTFIADVTDEAAIGRAVGDIERSLGPIDLLVNNAGVIGPLGPFIESTVADWWRTIEVDLLGQVICAHAVLPGMIARVGGCIVNLCSGGGATMFPYFSAYVTAKTALIRFSECLAHEVKPHGIAVFAMGPGTVRTAMSEHSLNSPEGRKWLPDSPTSSPRAAICLPSGRPRCYASSRRAGSTRSPAATSIRPTISSSCWRRCQTSKPANSIRSRSSVSER
jgi:NAD(P)-dependent dehydrogenase (short-subunit alcohol dehydrogenase family)